MPHAIFRTKLYDVFAVYLNFKVNRVVCILSGNPTPIPRSLRSSFFPSLSNLPSQENCSIERAIAVSVKESSEKGILVEYPKISDGFLNLCSQAGSCLKNRKMASRGTVEQLQDSTFMVQIKSQDKELKFRLRDYLCHIRK